MYISTKPQFLEPVVPPAEEITITLSRDDALEILATHTANFSTNSKTFARVVQYLKHLAALGRL